jgi:RNA polymerase sigma factor (sigma-70 family)
MVGTFVYDVRSADLDDLVLRAQGDPDNNSLAMNEIVRRFDNLAVKIGKQLTPDWMLQEDLSNAARWALTRAARKFKGGSAFAGYAKTYMVGAAKRELTQWKRTAAPNGSKPLHELDEIDGAEEVDHSVVDNIMYQAVMDAPEPLDRTWGSSRLMQIVSNLSEPQLQVMEMAYVEEMSVTEIAAWQNVSVAAISQRKALALALIERQIAAGWAA